MKLVQGVLIPLLLTNIAAGRGWVGQGRVHRSNGDSADISQFMAVDNSGYPWVCWMRSYQQDSTARWTRWLGDRWDEDQGMVPNPPSAAFVYPHSIVLTDSRYGWVGLGIQYEDNTTDMFSTRWNGSAWEPPIQINQPDSTEQDFGPAIAFGGSKLWSVWFGGPTPYPPLYKIYASRWNEELGQWEPEMEVSEQGNWFPDVAVDTLGRPHIVWCSVSKYAVYYSYFDGDSWSHPVIIHDTTRLTASPRACPRIEIDREGMLHTCFTGAYRGASHRDIFYTRNDGSGWDTCQLVTRDAVYDEWYSDIAADRPDNVWVVWDRQGEGPDRFRVYASRYDGEEWSPEERLDDDTTSYYDGSPAVVVDSVGNPWVVWNGISYSNGHFDVFYNCYNGLGIAEITPLVSSKLDLSFKVHSPSDRRIIIQYVLPASGYVVIDIYDKLGRWVSRSRWETQYSGKHLEVLDLGRNGKGMIAPGLYFCRIRALGVEEMSSFVLIKP
ncbi:MAG: hypothetical protein ABIK23_02885 [candidate division WOR-3 bacterium]